jgi:hypothetical protein
LKNGLSRKRLFFVLSSAIFSTLVAISPVRAVTVIGGSSLLTAGGAAQLEAWLDTTPLYSGSLRLDPPALIFAPLSMAKDLRFL